MRQFEFDASDFTDANRREQRKAELDRQVQAMKSSTEHYERKKTEIMPAGKLKGSDELRKLVIDRLGDKYQLMPHDEIVRRDSEKRAAEAEEEQKAWLLSHIKQHVELMPKKYKSASFDNYICESDSDRDNFKMCRTYADTFREGAREAGVGMIMYGATGRGKTYACFAIYRAVVEQGFAVIYDTAIEMLANMRNYHTDVEQAVTRYKTCDLLIIDEIGKQDGGDHARDTIFRVLHHRGAYELPTICASNFSEQVVKQYLTDAGHSRVLNGGISLRFTGRDRRNT